MSWTLAVKLALTMEARERQKACNFRSESSVGVATVRKINDGCYRCGKTDHKVNNCKYESYSCRNCNEKGHLQIMCRKSKSKSLKSNGSKSSGSKSKTSRRVMTVNLNKVETIGNGAVTKSLNVGGNTMLFEVDTGAAITIINQDEYQKMSNKPKLQSATVNVKLADGSKLDLIGEFILNCKGKFLRLRVAKSGLKNSLLGRDFLDILVPNWREQLGGSSIKSLQSSYNIDKLKKNFSAVFDKNNVAPVKNILVKIDLKKEAAPAFVRPYEIPFMLRDAVKTELNRLLKEGIISPVKYSNWASPVVIVRKKDGNVRLCVDFKKTVNPRIEVDTYPLLSIDELVGVVSRGTVFTTLYLTSEYQQLEVVKECREILTINTHLGLFRFNRLPFGISNAAAIFQKVMDQILAGVEGAVCYIDDILIYGNNLQECTKNLKEVLSRLRNYNFRVNLEKSKFFCDKVIFLGHEISGLGVKPSSEKIKDLINAKVPENITELKAFLGFVNYYRKFVPNMATTLHPLYELDKKDTKFFWSKKCQRAFKEAIMAVTNSEAIAPFNPEEDSIITSDASSYGIGAVLSQKVDGVEKVVCFFSRTLNEREKGWPQVQKEALAIVEAVKRFHKYIYGRKFVLVTHHQPLKSIFDRNKALPNHTLNRLQNYAIFLQGYDYEVKYQKGTCIGNADGLSRLHITSTESECTDIEVQTFR